MDVIWLKREGTWVSPRTHSAPVYGTEWSVTLVDTAENKQEGLAVASIARDDPSTFPIHDPFPRARMHRDRNAR